MIIKAKDFEIIDDLTLELKDGITVIVGPSNNGKSSIIRLLRSLIYNLNSDASIQQGKTSYTIGIVDGQNKIIVKRDINASNKTVYSVNGTVLKKVGRNPVPEVENALNMRLIDINKKKVELNFMQQMEYPFLIGESGGFIYDFLSSSSNQTDFNDLIKTMKTDLKDFSDKKKHLEGQTDVLKDLYNSSKETYEKLKDINTVTDAIIEFDSKIQYLQKLENTIHSLEFADANIFELNNSMDSLLAKVKILSNLDDIIKGYSDNIDMLNFCSNIESLNNQILSQSITLKRLDDLNTEIDLNSLTKLQSDITDKHQELTTLGNILDSINDTIELSSRLKNVNKSNDNMLNTLNEVLSLNSNLSALEADKLELSNYIENTQLLVDNLCKETFYHNETVSLLSLNKKELAEFDVCPICGSTIKGD